MSIARKNNNRQKAAIIFCGTAGVRTRDLILKRDLLYQLSYRPEITTNLQTANNYLTELVAKLQAACPPLAGATVPNEVD